MNQAAVLAGPLHGYGVPTVGPVPNNPASPFLSPQGKAGDPFPYNPAKAKSLLTSRGWTVVPNGSTTCTDPSLCGPGIKKGQTLDFTMPYATGYAWLTAEMDQLQPNLASIGIKLNLEAKPFNQVTAQSQATAW
jgi:peptide/nickel transport system substrate-binding protein